MSERDSLPDRCTCEAATKACGHSDDCQLIAEEPMDYTPMASQAEVARLRAALETIADGTQGSRSTWRTGVELARVAREALNGGEANG